jgi:alkanesulfonate monooxygenase SsuD/methylene tetrahydromethanopterin reductase-like flavin-dependent oxidoreductase (luciferase family)
MDIGIGLDPNLGISLDDQRTVVREATALGYTDAWAPARTTRLDAFHLCSQWHAASAQVKDGGGMTGISVVPAPVWTALTLAGQAATVAVLTGGHFILGIGTGGIYTEDFRRTFGLPPWPPIAAMRDYLTVIRGLLAGETINHEGPAVTLRGMKLDIRPPACPVYLAALGPQMLRLAGAASDGALLNWASPEAIAWSREQVVRGATHAGRDPSSVKVVQYIRVCIDDDVELARRTFAQEVIGYAMARPGASKERAYRGHFARMGFDAVLTDLESRRDRGAPMSELIKAMPDELLLRVGYFGRADGAAAAFHRLSEGLDTAIVRVISPRPGSIDAVRAAMLACKPDRVRAG